MSAAGGTWGGLPCGNHLRPPRLHFYRNGSRYAHEAEHVLHFCLLPREPRTVDIKRPSIGNARATIVVYVGNALSDFVVTLYLLSLVPPISLANMWARAGGGFRCWILSSSTLTTFSTSSSRTSCAVSPLLHERVKRWVEDLFRCSFALRDGGVHEL